MDALQALVLTSVIRAREPLINDRSNVAKLWIAFNLRHALHLPDFIQGNAATILPVSATLEEMRPPSEQNGEGLYLLASRIRESILTFDPQALGETIQINNEYPKPSTIAYTWRKDSPLDVLFSDQTFVQELARDWGAGLGRPVANRRPWNLQSTGWARRYNDLQIGRLISC